MTDDPYAAIARWYDLEHDGITEDIECYTSLIETPASGRADVLDIGSGTGRIAVALAVAGHQVTGIEPSGAMRELCARRVARLPERVARRIRIVDGTATAPGLGDAERFDVALVGLNSFAHLTTAEERQEALATIHSHLRPNGMLLIDLDLTGPRRLLDTVGQMWWQGTWDFVDEASAGEHAAAQTREQVSHFIAGSPGLDVGTVRATHFYDVHAPGGGVRRTIAPMTLALLSRGEVALALRQASFTVEALYGAYDLTPYDDLSPRALFVARRDG
ncbi:MAG: class I SAM-dependent methyltransferase [Ktedonobacterales bacterium]